ncbi:MAG: hypothetical protein IJJ23_08610, partial [Clostridia bacterium]|nr:hypothetical protein [Clostridia bacterium]
VKCEIPTDDGYITAWTGWKRFDHSTLDIDTVPLDERLSYDAPAGYSSSSSSEYARQGGYALAVDRLSTRTGPGTQYDGAGTYYVAGQWIFITGKAYDHGGVLWVKCEIPISDGYITAWTGWKRFDHSTLDISAIPEEHW